MLVEHHVLALLHHRVWGGGGGDREGGDLDLLVRRRDLLLVAVDGIVGVVDLHDGQDDGLDTELARGLAGVGHGGHHLDRLHRLVGRHRREEDDLAGLAHELSGEELVSQVRDVRVGH